MNQATTNPTPDPVRIALAQSFDALLHLSPMVSATQWHRLACARYSATRGEHVRSRLIACAMVVCCMPSVGKCSVDKASWFDSDVAYLHYTHPDGWHWYATGREAHGYEYRKGFITHRSLALRAILAAGAMLDIEWRPTSMGAIKRGQA